MTLVAAAYHVDDTDYQNVGIGSRPRTRRIYWRSLAVMMASARRFVGPDARLLISSNDRPGEDVAAVLRRIGCEVVSLPFRYETPTGFFHQFGGSWHLLDLVRHASENLDDGARLVILDPDCLMVADPTTMLQRLSDVGSLHYELDYRPDLVKMDMSRELFADVFADLSGSAVAAPPPYVGGEFVGLTGATARAVMPWVDEAWEDSLARHRRGERRLTTEEGVLSYVFWRLGHDEGGSGDLVQRVWTSPLYRNTDAIETERLTVWHLPAEKDRGFRRMYRALASERWFWDADDDHFRSQAAHLMGLRPGTSRRLRDAAWRVAYRAKQRLTDR